jgi:hypothetical protein
MFIVNGSRKSYVRLATACAALIVIALGCQAAAAWNSSQQSRSAGDTIESSWSTDGQRVEVNARNVELSDDGQTIKAIRNNGYLFIRDQRSGGRELKVVPGTNGNLSFSYSVRGQQKEFDAQARTWMAQTLLEFVRNSGYAADQRVSWLLSQRGPRGVLDEVSLIPSDNIKRIYLQKLAEGGNLNAANLIQVMEKARQEVTSDFELTEFLIAVKGKVNMSGEVRAAFMKDVERLQSESDRRKVLSALAGSGG